MDDQSQPQVTDDGNEGVALSDSDHNWSKEPPTIKNFPFTETPGMKVGVPADADPIIFSIWFLPRILLSIW